MAADSPRERLRENAVSVASSLVVASGLLALFAGIGWFWAIFVIGFLFVVPLVALLFGDESEKNEWWDSWGWDEDWGDWWDWSDESETETESATRSEPRPDGRESGSNRDALETLRYRYAQGDLTDEQFERKLERLLETDTLENVEDRRRSRERLRER